MKPTIGRIVHYVVSSGDTNRQDVVGRHLPAIIVNAWGNDKHDAQEMGSAVNLQVFTDSTNDGMPSVLWVTSAVYSSEPKGRTWHWPERE